MRSQTRYCGGGAEGGPVCHAARGGGAVRCKRSAAERGKGRTTATSRSRSACGVCGAAHHVLPPVLALDRRQDVEDAEYVEVGEVQLDLDLAEEALAVGGVLEGLWDLLDRHRLVRAVGKPPPARAHQAVGALADRLAHLILLGHLETHAAHGVELGAVLSEHVLLLVERFGAGGCHLEPSRG